MAKMTKFMIKFKKELNKNDLYNLFVTIFFIYDQKYRLKITNSKLY